MESVSAGSETVASEGLQASVSEGYCVCVVSPFMIEGRVKNPPVFVGKCLMLQIF